MATKHDLKRVMEEVGELELPDGAHWALVHERLGLEYGDAFDIIGEDPAFFGAVEQDVRGMTEFFRWYWAWFFS